jgi:WhiB family redox-sensing transcriptional regulator
MASSLFFHPPDERGAARYEREQGAKAICRSCPVIRECLAHSLAVQETYGIWGGLSETERQAVLDHPERRGRSASPHYGETRFEP